MRCRGAPSSSRPRCRTAPGRTASCACPATSAALVIDAKFPLEGLHPVPRCEGRRSPQPGRASGCATTSAGPCPKDIADKYLIPGETQDMAMMFVPAESVYADLSEHFDDVVQKAHRARVVIVSPSLLALAIQVMQALVRDARIREEARVIQVEVQKLLEDVGRLGERVGKLDSHFRQAQEDVAQIATSAEKIIKRGQNDRGARIRRERRGRSGRASPPAGPEPSRGGLIGGHAGANARGMEDRINPML